MRARVFFFRRCCSLSISLSSHISVPIHIFHSAASVCKPVCLQGNNKHTWHRIKSWRKMKNKKRTTQHKQGIEIEKSVSKKREWEPEPEPEREREREVEGEREKENLLRFTHYKYFSRKIDGTTAAWCRCRITAPQPMSVRRSIGQYVARHLRRSYSHFFLLSVSFVLSRMVYHSKQQTNLSDNLLMSVWPLFFFV